MNQLSSLIFVATTLAACSPDPSDTDLDADAGGIVGGNLDALGPAVDLDASGPGGPGPNLSCLNQPTPPPGAVPNPMLLAGQLVEYTTAGVTPVAAADIALVRVAQSSVVARARTATNGAFATGAFATNGQPMRAYVQATKQDYRTAFFYPPAPFTANSTTLVVPAISNAQFATIKTLLGATQDDAHNGALVVSVLDCDGNPLIGATVTVRRGTSAVGHAYDLGAAVPGVSGETIVLDVPEGVVRVSATYQNNQLSEHEVVVRARDPQCSTAKGTLTSTIVIPQS
jgi:hypothetical protein